jgi:hypothetical protein
MNLHVSKEVKINIFDNRNMFFESHSKNEGNIFTGTDLMRLKTCNMLRLSSSGL